MTTGGNNKNNKQVLTIAVGVVVVVVVVAVAVLIISGNKGSNSNASSNGNGSNVSSILAGNWTQTSPTGFPLATSATEQGQAINFMADGTLAMGSDTAKWRVVDSTHLGYTLGSYDFILTMSFTNDNKRLTITGTTVGTPRVIVLERQ